MAYQSFHMTTRRKNKPWTRSKLGRNTGSRGYPKTRFLIVCEGEKTEPNYFKSFRVSSAFVKVLGIGKNTTELVKKTIEISNLATDKGVPYDQVWAVFDRDSFAEKDFRSAIKQAKDNNIMVAYSNESFELWYLLHYSYHDVGISRKVYGEKLSKLLKTTYKKNSKDMYEKLYTQQETAIKYASKLLKSYVNLDPAKDNPSTTVHLLVKELNKNI